MIVDAYTLVGGVTLRQDAMGFPELFSAMEKTGVDLAAVISLRALHADARKGNDYLFAAAAGDPRIIPVGAVAPKASALDIPSIVSECVENGAAGLAFQMGQYMSLSSLAFRRALDEASKPGLPIVACAITEAGAPSQLAVLTRDMGCRLLLAGTFYILFDELLAVLEEHDHVYVDCSWVSTPGGVELLVRHGGPDRVLFGSGASIRPMQPTLNTVLDADIDDATKQRILAGNALRLFGRQVDAERLESKPVSLPALKVPSTPAIDVHNHLGTMPNISATVRDVDAVQGLAERFNMEYSVCSSYVAYYDDLDAGNQEMLDKIEGRPRLLGSPVISPTHLDASLRWLDTVPNNDRLAHATLTMDSVREPVGSQPYMRLFEEAARRGVPVFLNSAGLDPVRLLRWQRGAGYGPFVRGASSEEMAMFLEIDRRHPDLPVIIGHGLGEDGIRLVERTKSFYLELSGTYPDRDVLRRAIDTVGKERIVFGSDLDLIVPVFALGIYYEADMTPDEERLIMAENARRILGLPGNPQNSSDACRSR